MRQHPVEEDEIGHVLNRQAHRLLAVERLLDIEIGPLQVVGKQFLKRGFVFHDQYQRLHARSICHACSARFIRSRGVNRAFDSQDKEK